MNFPNGKTSVATVHTHGNYNVSENDRFFSTTDMDNARNRNLISYLINPSKEIRCYNPETGEEVILDWDFGN